MEKLDALGDYESASLLFDLLVLSHGKEWAEVNQRMGIQGRPEAIADESLLNEMQSIINAEHFVTFDDAGLLDDFFSKKTFSEWMLFLHPEQKKSLNASTVALHGYVAFQVAARPRYWFTARVSWRKIQPARAAGHLNSEHEQPSSKAS